MKISTTRFGGLELAEEDMITFREGVLGFENLSRFVLMEPSDESLVMWLQSVDDGSLAFPVIEPRIINGDYDFKPLPIDLKDLDLESLSGAEIYAVLTIPKDTREISANLKAPLVVNCARKIGKQVVLQNNKWPIRYPIYAALRSHMMTIANMGESKMEPDKPELVYSLRRERTL